MPVKFWRVVFTTGVGYTFWIGPDGQNFVQIGSLDTSFISTPTRAGFFIDSENNTLTVLINTLHWKVT